MNLDEVRQVSLDICKIKSHYGRWAARKGIHYHKLLVMYVIYESNECSQSEIMQLYGIPKQTINNIIKGMIQDGLIECIADQNGSRKKQVKYTEKGNAYASIILNPLLEMEDCVAKKMGEMQMSHLTNLLGSFERYIGEYVDSK